MRLSLHTVICCCVFATVLPPVRSATAEPNTSLRKMYRVWLQSHIRRDLPNSSVVTDVQSTETRDEALKDAETLPSPASFGSRQKRSPKQLGCILVTCIYHEMVHKLHEMKKLKDASAPKEKIGIFGYGRRRRSLVDTIQLAFQTGIQRSCCEAASKVCLAAETEDSS